MEKHRVVYSVLPDCHTVVMMCAMLNTQGSGQICFCLEMFYLTNWA